MGAQLNIIKGRFWGTFNHWLVMYDIYKTLNISNIHTYLHLQGLRGCRIVDAVQVTTSTQSGWIVATVRILPAEIFRLFVKSVESDAAGGDFTPSPSRIWTLVVLVGVIMFVNDVYCGCLRWLVMVTPMPRTLTWAGHVVLVLFLLLVLL